ncbi:MAG: SH3 domain-containing protein, partial [Clostridia bacterium]|nr:SH3 domain-containing protein [Clostridia bacterium]
MNRKIRFLLALALIAAMLCVFMLPAGAVELKTGIGIVQVNALRLRAKASLDAEILDNASKDDVVVVIRQVGDWYLVNYNLDIGYMYGEYLETKERENVDLGYGSIDPAVCNMRSGPSTSYSLVDQLYCGDEVFIFGFNCGWY